MRNGWAETTLGDVAEWWSGGTPKAREPKYYENGTIPWAVIADMNKGIIDSTNSYITKEALELIGGRLAPVGSVLISMYASVGKSAIANIPLATNQAIAWSIPNQKKIIPFYLYLVSQQLEKEISDLARGATQRNINRQMLREFTFQLPPLPEQKRIVDLISSVDSYNKALQQQLESAKRSRNAVLHALLTAGGDDWLRAGLSEICTMIKRGQAPSYTEQRSVTVLNQKCVRNGRIQFEFARQTDSNTKPINEWAYLRAEDTLVNSTGVGTLGRVAFVGPQDEPLTVDSHLTIVRPDENKIQPSFLGLSLHFREADIEGLAAGSSGQTELSREALGNLIITIPPIPEQKRIVEIITSMDKVTNQTQQTITESQNLRSGLLSDLLSGEHEIPSSYDKVIGAA